MYSDLQNLKIHFISFPEDNMAFRRLLDSISHIRELLLRVVEFEGSYRDETSDLVELGRQVPRNIALASGEEET